MEVILASAFGRAVDIQRGESDDLTGTAYTISQSMGEGQLTSRESLYLIFSELYFYTCLRVIMLYACMHSRQLSLGCSVGKIRFSPLAKGGLMAIHE